MKFNPGRLNRRALFRKASDTENEYAGTSVSYTDAVTTWVEKRIVSTNNQFAMEAGASALNEDCTFVMRKRPDYSPVVSDHIVCDGSTYTIKAICPYIDMYNSRGAEPAVVHETDFVYIVGTRKE
jgi:head-tail adaptor